MGTRGLTAVFVDGECRVAQYGQWDHHPSGQGVAALEFCRKNLINFVGRESFKDALRRTRFVGDEYIRGLYEELDIEFSEHGGVQIDDADRFAQAHPQLDRDMGAKILDFVFNSKGEVMLQDSLSFASDSLFCEYAYVVDLDQLQLEVYKGFNKKPVPCGERFAELPREEPNHRPAEYYPVRLLKAYPLTDLPTAGEFTAELEDDDGDEDDEESAQ